MPSLRIETELNDKLWEFAKPLLPAPRPHPKGGRPFVSDRACFEGIVIVLRSGCRWRDLDRTEGVPSGPTCWRRLRDWARAGVWEAVWSAVVVELDRLGLLDTSELSADATFVEARKGGSSSALQNVGMV